MYDKKRLKNERSIKNDKTISLVFEFSIISKLLVGKNPPDEIIVMAKFKELNALMSKILSITEKQ